MAEEKPDVAKKEKEPKGEFTTVRIRVADGEDISTLAGLEDRTAADVFGDYCAPVIRKLLRDKMRDRLKKLGG